MAKAACAFAFVMLSIGAALAQSVEERFPRPAQLDGAVAFWTRVYTEVGTDGGFIHDSERLEVVYDTLHFGENAGSRARQRAVRAATSRYRDILVDLAGDRSSLSDEERRVLELWPDDVSSAELRRAADRLRFQLGQANRFRAGLVRSGTWREYIHRVLDQAELPRELSVLPHVESSFDPTAYSKVGAAGMWQFTRSTGLRYMTIDHIVDERRDPFFSTVAAAKLLQANYDVLGTWPLALTAYNHGAGGMRRAVREHGTTDMGVIAQNYKGRTFGFASRNFYAAFLAALDVDTHAERYFGPVETAPPDDSVVMPLPDYMAAGTVAAALGLTLRDLQRLNPALMDTVWAGDKFVPKGFPLRVPAHLAGDPLNLLAAVPASQRYAAQRPDLEHRVRRGDTLSQIASRYRVSQAALVRANGLRSQDFIREGQVLTLPVTGAAAPPTLAEAAGGAAPANGRYTVRRGDNVAAIARRFGIDQQALLAANDIRDRNRIYAGQVLQLPGAGSPDSGERGAAPVLVAASDQAPLEAPAAEAAGAAAPAVDAEALEALEAAASEEPAPVVADTDANALASRQADLAADPSDYTVAADGTIEVQALETLGHYADWLGIRTQRLRDINGLAFREAVVLGQRIRLGLSGEEAAAFEQRRLAYHEQHQEAFFSSYRIADVTDHVVRTGESLWVLAHRRYEVPVWLLRQFNPDLDLDRVRPGTVVKFPQLRPIAASTGEVSTSDELS